jgi:hypothetical protein
MHSRTPRSARFTGPIAAAGIDFDARRYLIRLRVEAARAYRNQMHHDGDRGKATTRPPTYG